MVKELNKLDIRKVLQRKDGVKMVIVPKESEISKGDYVRIIKLKEEVNKNGRGKERKEK
jgi:hypothetical protein